MTMKMIERKTTGVNLIKISILIIKWDSSIRLIGINQKIK